MTFTDFLDTKPWKDDRTWLCVLVIVVAVMAGFDSPRNLSSPWYWAGIVGGLAAVIAFGRNIRFWPKPIFPALFLIVLVPVYFIGRFCGIDLMHNVIFIVVVIAWAVASIVACCLMFNKMQSWWPRIGEMATRYPTAATRLQQQLPRVLVKDWDCDRDQCFDSNKGKMKRRRVNYRKLQRLFYMTEQDWATLDGDHPETCPIFGKKGLWDKTLDFMFANCSYDIYDFWA